MATLSAEMREHGIPRWTSAAMVAAYIAYDIALYAGLPARLGG